MHQHWTGRPDTTDVCGTSRANWPSSEPSSWVPSMLQALARLETGQVLNRKAGEARVAHLQDHVDARIADLRHDLGGRMDRMETRVSLIEHGQPQPAPPQPGASPPPSFTVPAASTDGPWWREMSPREALLWLVVLLTALGVIPVETLERIMRALVGALAQIGAPPK